MGVWMKYFFAGTGGASLGIILASTNDFRLLFPFVLGCIGAFMFGMDVKK
jgi:hypothetical protein